MKKTLLIAALLLALVIGCATDAKAEEERFGEALSLTGTNGKGLEWTLPRFPAGTEEWDEINRYYKALAEKLAMVSTETVQTVTFETKHLSERYLSVVLSFREQGGNGEHEHLSADTFALDGLYAGKKLTLSQVLGMEETQDPSAAAQLAWDLVWQIAAQEAQNPQSAYLEGLSVQNVQNAFQPETDFYLDADGNIVFWIAPGELAGEMAGILLFPFAPGELMSAVGEG